jgi:hypothetical protein
MPVKPASGQIPAQSRKCMGDYFELNNVWTVRFPPSRALSREMQHAPSSKPAITDMETPIEGSVLSASAGMNSTPSILDSVPQVYEQGFCQTRVGTLGDRR